MAGVDAKLADSLKHAKTNPMSFVFVAKGSEGKLLVDKKKVSPKDADTAKKACGGGTIYKGRCQGEDSKMVFYVGKEVPATLNALTKKIIRQDAGLTLDVEYRLAADLAAEESQAEATGEGGNPTAAAPPPPASPPSAPPTPQPAPGGAEVIKRLNAMSANIKAALAGPNKARVQTLFVSVNGLIKNSDFVKAGTVLNELEPLLAPSSASLPSSASSPTPSQPQPSPGGAEVIKRLNAMSADIKAALTGPDKARVQALFVSVNGLIKNKDFVAAGTALDELEPLVAKPTGAPAAASAAVPPAPPDAAAPTPPAPANDAALAAEWERRMAAIEPRVLEAQKTRAREGKWMTMFMSAQDLGFEGDFAKSLAILDKLEGLLNAPAKTTAAGPQIGGQVAFAHAKIRWNEAKDAAGRQLAALQKKILEEFNDPESADAAKRLKKVLERFNEGLGDALDDLYVAEEAQRPARRKRVGDIASTYLVYVRGDPLVLHVEDNPFLEVAVQDTLEQPLLDLQAQLAAR